MHHHLDQETLIIEILSKIAQKKKKSLERVKHLLLINQNTAINRLFWEILDGTLYVDTRITTALIQPAPTSNASPLHVKAKAALLVVKKQPNCGSTNSIKYFHEPLGNTSLQPFPQ